MFWIEVRDSISGTFQNVLRHRPEVGFKYKLRPAYHTKNLAKVDARKVVLAFPEWVDIRVNSPKGIPYTVKRGV